MVASLSFHSVIAGLTLGLEKETSGVWINFGAIAMHKFVIAFSVGIELVTSRVSLEKKTKKQWGHSLFESDEISFEVFRAHNLTRYSLNKNDFGNRERA